MSYLKGLGNSVQSQGGFKKWPISDVDPLPGVRPLLSPAAAGRTAATAAVAGRCGARRPGRSTTRGALPPL